MSRFLLIFSGVEVFSFDSVESVKSFLTQSDPNGEQIVEVYDQDRYVYINIWANNDEEKVDWEKEGF